MKKYGNNDRYVIHVFNPLKGIEYWYYRATKKAAENVAEREHKKNVDGTICVITDLKTGTTLYTYIADTRISGIYKSARGIDGMKIGIK